MHILIELPNNFHGLINELVVVHIFTSQEQSFEHAILSPLQMGTNYKAALIPQRIRETIHGWGKAARRKRRMRMYPDDSTVRTDTSTVISLEEYDNQLVDSPRTVHGADTEIELQPPSIVTDDHHSVTINETSSRVGTPLLRPCASISSAASPRFPHEVLARSSSMPARGDLGKD